MCAVGVGGAGEQALEVVLVPEPQRRGPVRRRGRRRRRRAPRPRSAAAARDRVEVAAVARATSGGAGRCRRACRGRATRPGGRWRPGPGARSGGGWCPGWRRAGAGRGGVGPRRWRSTGRCSRRSGAGSARTGRPAWGSAGRRARRGGSRSVSGSTRHALGGDPPVGRQSQGEEHRGPVGLAVRGGEHPADGAVLHRQPGQVGSVLAAPGRAHPPRRLVLVALVLVVGRRRRVGLVFGFGVEVPALPALLDPQPAGLLGARRAAVLPGRPQAIGTTRTSPDSTSVTRATTGRGHTPAIAPPPHELGARCRVHAPAARWDRRLHAWPAV